jgi:rhodanese-related sulfurtransferase
MGVTDCTQVLKIIFMRKALLILLSFVLLQQVSAQYKYDNTLFKTIFWDDLCKELQKPDGHLLLDVRSKGEFSDTSSAGYLNIGHLKGALNIDIRQLPDSIGKLEAYKDKTIYVYCSHSQRSRRVSRMLSEKGFTKVVNVNGGMTMFNLLKNTIPCAQSVYETLVPYPFLSPGELCSLPAPAYFILDIRPDSVYRQISRDARQNAYGRIRGAVNIPLADLPAALGRIPKNKKIIIVDDSGDDSPKAARLLGENGYKDLAILFNGMDRWSFSDPAALTCKKEWTEHLTAYGALSPEEFERMVSGSGTASGGGTGSGSSGGTGMAAGRKDLLILDIRSTAEFASQSRDDWRNIGHIRQAVNIPGTELQARVAEIETFKAKPVIVYALSSSPDAFAWASWLSGKGFSRVSVLMGGLFDLRWMAANVKDHQALKELVTDIPAGNL